MRWPLISLFALATFYRAAPAIETVDLTLVDAQATGYGTFQSNSQKVLQNAHGIFMSHARTRNEAYTAQQWRLSRSVDGGRTFQTVYEETSATHPPVIETDPTGNIYLFRTDFVNQCAMSYRFLAAENYAKPHPTRIDVTAPGKYAALYDASRKQLYFAPQSHTPFVVSLSDAVAPSSTVLKTGLHAEFQYPHLSEETGILYEAWTTSRPGRFDYWDIHLMRSSDGAKTWETLAGQPLASPIVVDDTGPTDRVTLDDEFESSTWLSSFLVRNGKGHFLYRAETDPPRQHYVRYDLTSGKRELDTSPHLRGETIELGGLDGFFAADASALYCVSHTPDHRVGCLVSRDDGTSWHDHAVTAKPVPGLYAVGGARRIEKGGRLIGSFTAANDVDASQPPRVYFFSIPTAQSLP